MLSAKAAANRFRQKTLCSVYPVLALEDFAASVRLLVAI